MDLLHRSIRELAPFLQNRFRSFISPSLSGQAGDSNDAALVKLFNLFTSSKTSFSEKELEEKIYGERSSEKSRRVSMLRHRLMEKLELFLISEQFLEKNRNMDNFTAARIRIIKRMGGFSALHKIQPTNPLAMRWLDQAISFSLKDEQYPLLLHALERKQQALGHGNRQELLKWEKKIDHYETEGKGVRKAVLYFCLLTALKSKTAKPDLKKIGRLHRQYLRELKTYHAKTNSPTILYYMNYLRCDDCQNKRHYSKAIKHLHDIIALMKKYPSLLRKDRMGFANDNLAQTYSMMGWHTTALHYLHIAQSYLSNKTVDMALSQEQEYFVLMQSGQYEKAKHLAGKMFQNPAVRTEQYKHLSDKTVFYIACAHYQCGEYEKALHCIQKKLSITQDKEGWAFSLRLLHLYLLIELGSQKEVQHCLKLFDKFIAYHRSKLCKRNQLILQTFSLLRRCDFNPGAEALEKIKRNLKLLGSSKADYCWDSQGDEVIRFEGWVKRKYLN